MSPATAHLAQIGALPFVEFVAFCLGFAQQVSDLGGGQVLVRYRT
jgi:hypothetical protein